MSFGALYIQHAHQLAVYANRHGQFRLSDHLRFVGEWINVPGFPADVISQQGLIVLPHPAHHSLSQIQVMSRFKQVFIRTGFGFHYHAVLVWVKQKQAHVVVVKALVYLAGGVGQRGFQITHGGNLFAQVIRHTELRYPQSQ